tara:strand:- start:10 stop:228 length:219 start_codon:yes stop_codon:yes gene_type:complete
MAKKFNGMERFMLQEALKNHVTKLEKKVKKHEKKGNRLLYAPGFFSMIGDELSTKIDEMTLKGDLPKKNNNN